MRYLVPHQHVAIEQRIKNSLFIGQLFHCPNQAAAVEIINRVTLAHAKATHNCRAYIAGPPNTAIRGQSDDGEPKGCAGRPMLNVLQHSGLGEICAVVTRYYGGIKLGTGGLVRAYSSTVQQALKHIVTAEQIPSRTLHLILGYADLDQVGRLLRQQGGTIIEKHFEENIRIRLEVPEEKTNELLRTITAHFGGRVALHEGDSGREYGNTHCGHL